MKKVYRESTEVGRTSEPFVESLAQCL